MIVKALSWTAIFSLQFSRIVDFDFSLFQGEFPFLHARWDLSLDFGVNGHPWHDCLHVQYISLLILTSKIDIRLEILRHLCLYEADVILNVRVRFHFGQI